MKELGEIVAAWDALCAEDCEAILATVVSVSGSTYRRPGARMLLSPEGRLAGSVSGGCLEGDILKKATWHTRDGAALITYDSTDEDDVVWGFGLGCNGVVQVLLERVSPHMPGPLRLLASVLRQRRPGVIATIISGDSLESLSEHLLLMPDGTRESTILNAELEEQVAEDAAAVLAAQKSRTQTYARPNGKTAIIFLEAVLPPLPPVIFGAGHDVLPLVRFAKELGWHVTLVDVRATSPRPERFPQADAVLVGSIETSSGLEMSSRNVDLSPQTAAVVMTHNYPDDKRILRHLLASPVFYLGQLGPRARTERLLAELRDDGFPITDVHQSRLHGPVGLDLGADTPEQIALSVASEIQAVQAGRTGNLLRERPDPLHPRHAQVSLHAPALAKIRENPVCPL